MRWSARHDMAGTGSDARRRVRPAAHAPAMTIIAVLGLLATLLLPAGASAQLEAAPTDPQLFDLALARRELTAIEAEVSSLEQRIDAELSQIDGLSSEMDFLELNRPARADALRTARVRARQMAVAAYVGIGPPLSGLDLLDAETASDLSWQNALMRQQAERLNTAAETYAVLAGEADANLLVLNDDVNAASRRVEALRRELTQVAEQIPQAEWYIEIATIHDFASREFERTGRDEPSAEQWEDLRFCESTGTYDIDTGNTFYGAYQFTWDTWGTVGGDGNPAHAPPAEQDARARLLYAQRGDQPWPICGRYVRYPQQPGG